MNMKKPSLPKGKEITWISGAAACPDGRSKNKPDTMILISS